MYSGHFAAGLSLSARFRRVPPLAIFVGVGLIDLIDGALVAAGVERVKPDLAVPLGFDLDFIDWDHSLLMACMWSALFGALAYFVFGRYARTGLVAAAAALSHIVLDLVVHDGDLALYPHSSIHFGLYLWRDFPIGSYFLELGIDLAAIAYFARREQRWVWPAVLLLAIQASWWSAINPMRMVAAHVPMPTAAVVHGVLVFVGFALPAAVFGWLVARARATKAVA